MIKIGILIDGLEQPLWVNEIVERILKDSSLDLSLVVIKNNKSQTDNNIFKRFFEIKYYPYFLIKIINKFIYKYIIKNNDYVNLFSNLSIESKLSLNSTPILRVEVIENKFTDEFKSSDIENISQYDCDLFIRFGFRILKGGILNLPKLGIWSLHHGDTKDGRGGPAGFWEFIEKKNTTAATLQILSEVLDGGLVLDKVSVQTNKINYFSNISTLYANAAGMLWDNLEKFKILGIENYLVKIDKLRKSRDLDIYSYPIFKRPTFLKGLILLIKLLVRYFYLALYKFWYFEQWQLSYKFLKTSDNVHLSLYNFKRIIPPFDRYFADPFVIEQDDTIYVFIEEVIYSQNKGTIALLEINKISKKVSFKGKILEESFHMSFPNVFFLNGEYYMIPETQKANQIRMYKAQKFPYEWTLERVLIDNIHAVDPVLHIHDGVFWLLVNESTFLGASPSSNLNLYYTDNLFEGKFKKFANNPVSSDIKFSRNAGAIFKIGNKTFRPSQDCSERYGYSVNINEIVEINKESYNETLRDVILPKWDNSAIAIHTLSVSENIVFVDVNKRLPRISKIFNLFSKKDLS
jgi:hypothetical protein